MNFSGAPTLSDSMATGVGRGRKRDLPPEVAESVREALRQYAKGKSQTAAAEAVGVKQQHLSNLLKAGTDKQPSRLVAERLGKLIGRDLLAKVPLETATQSDIQRKQQPYQSPSETAVTLRDAAANDHWFPDHIEELAIRLIRLPDAPEYSPAQLRAAKVFVREMAALLKDPSDLLGTMASAAEAARALEADKRPLTFLEITLRLAQQARPKFVPPPAAQSAKDRILARARAEEDEDSKPPPGTRPAGDE